MLVGRIFKVLPPTERVDSLRNEKQHERNEKRGERGLFKDIGYPTKCPFAFLNPINWVNGGRSCLNVCQVFLFFFFFDFRILFAEENLVVVLKKNRKPRILARWFLWSGRGLVYQMRCSQREGILLYSFFFHLNVEVPWMTVYYWGYVRLSVGEKTKLMII